MSESPSTTAREAKSIHQSLKELLKTREPYDKEVDIQRKNLRKQYLALLLVHSSAKESKDVENHLWMQTSYIFISAYKQRIAADRTIQNNHAQNQQQQQIGQGHLNKRSNPHHGVVEQRKLVQRFKQFLAEEEKFWAQLVLRLYRLFDLYDVRPSIVASGLLTEADETLATPSIHSVGESAGRNHFQFPPEDLSRRAAPGNDEEREEHLVTLSKALICLGDIARYREQYNESNGRPKAGQDELIPARRGRGRRGGGPDGFVRPRNYDKAQQCYEQARLIVPSVGNPSHQLAIIASYKKDMFTSILHYYRSLCVRHPYDTASENLGIVLSKALDNFKQKLKKERNEAALDPTTSVQPIHIRVDLLQEQVVALHALWRVGLEKGTDKMRAVLPKHNEKVAKSFFTLVSQRHLPEYMILNTVILSQGAVWKHRMIRDPRPSRNRHNEIHIPPEGTEIQIEWDILNHLLDLHLSLLEVGKDELKDPPQTDVTDDPAQRISATFRRTLPALRIASKWLRANFKYLSSDREFLAFQKTEKLKGIDVFKADPAKISAYSTKTIDFWKAYAAFMLLLLQAFPKDKLPVFDGPLDEDIEMIGFLPLQGYLAENKKTAAEKVHPNVEQLMRISDLFADAKELIELPNSPLQIINGHFLFRLDIVEENRQPSHTEIITLTVEQAASTPEQILMASIRDSLPKPVPDVDAISEFTTRTEDDLIHEAFQFLDKADDHDDNDLEDDDEVVYMNSSPTTSLQTFATPITPVKPRLSPENISPRSPTLHHPAKPLSFSPPTAATPAIHGTTAQDLLDNVLGNHRRRGSQNQVSGSTAPQSTLLFGSESTRRPGLSIWSTAQDEQPLMYTPSMPTSNVGLANHKLSQSTLYSTNNSFTNGPGIQTTSTVASGQLYSSAPSFHQTQLPQNQNLSLSQQTIWSSSIGSSQNSQQNLVGPLPSAPFAQPPHMGLGTVGSGFTAGNMTPYHHNRASSGSIPGLSGQLFSSGQLQTDPFAYPSPVLHQPPIHRPEPLLPNAGFIGSSLSHGGLPPIGEVASQMNASLAGGSAGPGQPYYMSPPPAHHSRPGSMNDGRTISQSYFTQPNPLAWGNAG